MFGAGLEQPTFWSYENLLYLLSTSPPSVNIDFKKSLKKKKGWETAHKAATQSKQLHHPLLGPRPTS